MAERTFRDDAGRWWRVREVRAVDPCLLPAAYCEGWLTFAGEDGGKRRLAPVPAAWEELSEEALRALVVVARPAPGSDDVGAFERAEDGSAAAGGA